MNTNQEPLLWALWHPHQGLWNWTLLDGLQKLKPIAPAYRLISTAIVHLDTAFLFLRALVARVSLLGASYLFRKAHVPDDVSILYLDAGTHREGRELSLVVDELLPKICNNYQAYGFEANEKSFRHVAKLNVGKDNVQLIHKALVRNLPDSGTIRLYNDMVSGLGDSVYRRTAQYEDVQCMRLSDFFREIVLSEGNIIVLLRMNIEGSEYDVIQDLVENRLSNFVDGYFGMWDDTSKIDIQRDAEFRAFLASHQIHPFTFNGRDLNWPVRRQCIEYHLHTRIFLALRKFQRRQLGSSGIRSI